MSVPLVFQDVINILNVAVDRPDIAATSNGYTDFINRALREIAAGHSFDQMSETVSVTLVSGQPQVTLPSDFKDLQPGRFPVYASIGGAPQVPIPVFRKEEISRLQLGGFIPNPSLIYTSDNNGFQLGLLPPNVAAANWVCLLYYFGYPAVVTLAQAATTGSPLLTFYPGLVIEKTLSLVFQSINDPIWEQHEQQFGELMKEFIAADISITAPERSN